MANRTLPPLPEEPQHRTGSKWIELLLQVGDTTENAIDRLKQNFSRRFKPDEPLQIVPYRGFANRDNAYLMGRVLEYSKPQDTDTESLWNTLLASYQRFETDEVPGIDVKATLAGQSYHTTTDSEGYYTFHLSAGSIENREPTSATSTEYSVEISLPTASHRCSNVSATVVRPTSDARFGVISDIDDTVLLTKATSLLQMMRLTLMSSSKTRVAFEGVSAFYRALHNDRNPFFYVSSSPWNLYEFLDDFMQLKGIVPGPILLRDFGIDRTKFIAGEHKTHKLAQITKVLHCYPDLPFILIGDSGQKDPEIYAQCVKDYPGRILAIYIRNASDADEQDALAQRLTTLRADNVPMLLVENTLQAAEHAAEAGYISKDSIASIEVDKNHDKLINKIESNADKQSISGLLPD